MILKLDICIWLLVLFYTTQFFIFTLASTGNYFGTHFFIGGEKFETMKPDVYLFGENEDLNFLGSKPSPVSDYFDVRNGWIILGWIAWI